MRCPICRVLPPIALSFSLALLSIIIAARPAPAADLSSVAPASTAPIQASPEYARNWPQWRGPLGTGVAPEAHPPVEWNAATADTASPQKNIKWKVELPGAGSATPVIWGNQIFIHTAIPTGRKIELPAEPPADPNAPVDPKAKSFNIGRPDEYHQFVLLSLDRKTGQELWRKVAAEVVPHEGHHADHGYASYSPVTDGTCVISFFGSRGLHCYDMQGNLKWEKDLGKMQTRYSFGEASSPALYGNTVVVDWDHEAGSFIVAFDKNTGDELWRTPRDEKTAWATPLIVPTADQTLVVTTGNPTARAYNLADGKLVWQCGGLTPLPIPTPVTAGGLVYLMSGFQGSSLLAIRLGQTGDLTDTSAIAWKFDKDTPYVPSPLLYDNRLYCFKVNKTILSCFNAATGDRLFGPQRLEGMDDVYASPVGAAGNVYLVGRNGTTVVIRNADQFEVLATNPLGEAVDASPAIVGNDLFLRSKGHDGPGHLFCIEESN